MWIFARNGNRPYQAYPEFPEDFVMSARLQQFLESELPAFLAKLDELDRRIPADAEPNEDALAAEVIEAVDGVLVHCSEVEQSLEDDTPALRAAQTQFRAAIAPWFQKSWFMQHALTKPRGYAGDYQMLTAVYDREIKSRGLGGYLDRYFLQTELGTSVPLRLQMAREYLSGLARERRQLRILNVASGPGREYRGGWGLPEDCRVEVICVDQDDSALDFVQQTVVPTLPPNQTLQLTKYNALKMGNATLNREVFGDCDVVYSIGLCDYIPDRLMIRLLRGWRETVKPNGIIYVAFKDCIEYGKEKYQWLVDWYFYQRTVEECRDLFAQAGYDMSEMQMTRDETRSIINFISQQPADVTTPQDSSSEVVVTIS